MGLSDTLVLLDDLAGAVCAAGHEQRSFQTKDVDEPSMCIYLVHRGRLLLASSGREDDSEPSVWRVAGEEAVREHRFRLTDVGRARQIRAYGRCKECDPVLVRSDDASYLGDLVREHTVFVDFLFTFRPGEPVQVERTTGTREDFMADLRARGFYVLRDDEPLAIAHREIQRARERAGKRSQWD